MKEAIVLSIGGSLIVPNGGIDVDFLRKLNLFVRKNVSQNRRFFLVTGGGSTARHYIDAGRGVVKKITNEDLDWLGIHSTHLNGHLLRTIFRDIAHPRIVINYDRKLLNLHEPVVIGAGWKPGWSTDYDAVIFAKDYGANLIVNLSNIYYVYDKDPRKFTDAKPIELTTWDYFEGLVGNKWTPGLSSPFDPIAAQLAKKNNITVIVTKGTDFNNLQRLIDGESFKGTVIKRYDINPEYYDREYYLGKKGEYRYLSGKTFSRQVLQKLANWYRALYIKLHFNPKTVLDVGCGTGGLVAVLRNFGIDAKGLEISKDALSLAENTVKEHLSYGDVKKIPFPENSFDMVVSFDVLEHIERSSLRQVVKETIRVAKKQILHKIYTKENLAINLLHGNDSSHVSIYPKGFWEHLFNSFKNIQVARKFFRFPSLIETIYYLKKN